MNKINELHNKIEAIINCPGKLDIDGINNLLDLGKQLDLELDKAQDEINDLGPNVLQLDQNKRKRVLNGRFYKNNAQVIKFERK